LASAARTFTCRFTMFLRLFSDVFAMAYLTVALDALLSFS
jgi:hypothetical protein